MLRTGLIVDLNNLYHAVHGKFGNTRLMMARYVERLEADHTVLYKVAFGQQRAPQFEALLTNLGFECYFDNCDWAVQIALTAADMLANIDCLVVGSNHPELAQIYRWARKHGKIVKVYACRIPHSLRPCAELMEINWSQLDAAPAVTKPMELPSNKSGDGVG